MRIETFEPRHQHRDEIKWTNITRRSQQFRCELVKEFFKRTWLMFRCIVRVGYIDQCNERTAKSGEKSLAVARWKPDTADHVLQLSSHALSSRFVEAIDMALPRPGIVRRAASSGWRLHAPSATARDRLRSRREGTRDKPHGGRSAR